MRGTELEKSRTKERERERESWARINKQRFNSFPSLFAGPHVSTHDVWRSVHLGRSDGLAAKIKFTENSLLMTPQRIIITFFILFLENKIYFVFKEIDDVCARGKNKKKKQLNMSMSG